MRTPVKRIGERLLLRSGLAAACRRRFAGRAIVLVYHNVLPDGSEPDGDASLHVPHRRFCEHLDRVERACDVVPLGSLLEPGRSSPGGRPRAAITFDDAYRGAVTIGAEELERRGLPATFFVVPGLLGGVRFWWDALADPRTGTVAESVRRRSLEDLAGRQVAIMSDAPASAGEGSLPPEAASATEEELREAASRPGITVASHSWDHPNLTRLAARELEKQMERPLTWLRERFETVVPYLSYPYGLSDPMVAGAAKETGYRAALRIDGGWLPERAENSYALPRLNVPRGLTPEGLELRLSGIGAGR